MCLFVSKPKARDWAGKHTGLNSPTQGDTVPLKSNVYEECKAKPLMNKLLQVCDFLKH